MVGDKDGYALTRRSLDGAPKRQVRLHRLAYTQHHGIAYDAIDGQLVRHTCDNPRCIEPTHLVLGAPADNSRDMVERGRSLRNERHPGVKVTDEAAADIRRQFVAGSGRGRRDSNAKQLAEEYGITAVQVRNIGHGRQR